jgi:ubiquinone/menaquinone biosynthesis C-methylase UbiE
MAGLLLLDHVPLDVRRVLDIGSGTGFPALEIAERLGPDARVAGLDPWTPAMARAGAKRASWSVPNADLVRGDAAVMPFREGAFDLVVSNLGVNNFSDPDRVLDECRRVLAAGGALALSTNRSGHMKELYEVYAGVLAGDDAALGRLESHIDHRGTVESLVARLERHGFRVVERHERTATFRFRSGAAILGHHFLRLGFIPGWHEVAGEDRVEERMEALRAALDRHAEAHGEIRLTVPFLMLLARRESG